MAARRPAGAVQTRGIGLTHKDAPAALMHSAMQHTATHKTTLSRSNARCRRSRPVYRRLSTLRLLPASVDSNHFDANARIRNVSLVPDRTARKQCQK